MCLLRYWKSIVWIIIIFILSSISGNELNKIPKINIPHFDKIVHFSMYFILSFLLFIDFTKRDNSKTKNILFIFLFSISYGVLLEFMQEYVFIKRGADFFDFLANISGSTLAISLSILFYKKIPLKLYK